MFSKINLIVFLLIQVSVFGQTQLTNVYSSFNKVNGGAEDNGISGSETYLFLSKKKVVLNQLFYENKEIIITKKDSLIVTVQTNLAYNSTATSTQDSLLSNEIKNANVQALQDFAQVSKRGNTYYIYIPYPHEWDGTLVYRYKDKKYTSSKKEKFDKGYEGYAP